MNKSIIALAVASAATMVSVAQADNTTLYGRVAMEYTYEINGTEGKQSHIGNAGSRFGIKGTDDLGNGLEAFYKMEMGVSEGEGANGTKKLYVGLKGEFGQVSFGKQNLPHDGISNNTDPFNTTSPALRHVGNYGIALDTSSTNSLVYKTPDMDGFTASAAIVVNKASNATSGNNTLSEEVDMYNFAAEYANNGIYAGLSYLATGDNDQRTLGLGLGYESGEAAGDFNVGLLVEGTHVDMGNDTAKAMYYRLGGAYNISDMDSVYASVDGGHFEDADTSTFGAGIGYQHKLSNRTKVWAEYGYQDLDTDNSDSDDVNVISLGLRTDF